MWQRIRDFRIDAPNAPFPFSARLARESGWTPAYAARVVDEYRRFAFLAVVAGHGVTPSKAVDQAWHLHLLYTRNYWEEFCPKTLGRPLHHNPSSGTLEDEAKYEGWYDATLVSYARLFGEPPPADIWPRSAEPAKPTRRAWPFLGLLATMLAGCNEPANPLDWRGPEFLGLFAVLYGCALLIAYAARRALIRPVDGPPAEEWRLHVYEQAFLNGGETLALATALAHLTARNFLEVDRKTGRIRATVPSADADHPLDRAILRATEPPTGTKYEGISSRAKPILAEIETSLRRQGLWVRHEEMAATTLLPLTIASLPLLLGAAKILVGLSRERPVGFLIVGCVVAFGINLLLLIPPKRSVYGERVLDRLRETRPNDRYAAYRTTLSPVDLSTGMALYGLTALEGGEYAYLRSSITPQTPTSSGDGGGSSGCSSSSCGGGGGCGGGGCGGCGS